MADQSLKETILRLAEPAVTAQGLEVWGLELTESARMLVRLFVEAPRPVMEDGAHAATDDDTGQLALASATVDQCEAISRQLALALDAEDLIERAYTLEVSSPGFNRIFFTASQMAPYAGDMVEARLPSPWSPGEGWPARRIWRGILGEVDDKGFTLTPARADEDGEVTLEDIPPLRIPFTLPRRVHRVHIFRRPQKPGKGARRAKKAQRGNS